MYTVYKSCKVLCDSPFLRASPRAFFHHLSLDWEINTNTMAIFRRARLCARCMYNWLPIHSMASLVYAFTPFLLFRFYLVDYVPTTMERIV